MSYSVLHINPWCSRQSEILYTCENKRKQSRGWTKMCGCYKMIYADAHVRYGDWEFPSWSLSLRSRERQRVAGRPLGQRPTADLRWLHPHQTRSRSVKFGLEDKTPLDGQEKMLWSIWPRWPSVFASLSLSLTHLQKLWIHERIKRVIFFTTKCYGRSSSMYIYSLWVHNTQDTLCGWGSYSLAWGILSRFQASLIGRFKCEGLLVLRISI